jgi:sialate O-acetylesterase
MLGPVEEVGLRFDDGEFVPLGTEWRYRYIPRETGQPPRSPWESVSGVAGMFNGMIAPLAPLKLAGVIWYQGESNAETSESYAALLTELIADWRRQFADDTLPFVVVQLPNYGSIATAPGASGWATLRNAQQRVALADARVGLVVTHDAGDDADIHPKRKFIVAERAAEVARALRTGEGFADGVVAQIVEVGARTLTLDFSPALSANTNANASAGEATRPNANASDLGQPIAGFTLCDKTANRCVFATATQNGGRVEIDLDAYPNAELLRYCWSDGGQCALTARNGWPVSSFELPL